MSEYQSGGGGGGGDKNNDLKIFPLRNEDLVFSKNRDGILSCGYKVSNALLNSTLSMSMMGGGSKDAKKEHGKNKANENEIKTAKLMEDLVIPSSLYCSKSTNNSKVFNYKKGKREKSKKGSRSSSDNESDDNVIEESLYDKLLSLVTPSNKVKYDKKTRKKVDQDNKINIKKDTKNTPIKKSTPEDGVKKNKNSKTKKVRFNLE